MELVSAMPHLPERARGSEQLITVSAPEGYPIRQVEAQLVLSAGGTLGVYPVDSTFAVLAENGRRVIRMAAQLPGRHAAPIVRFTDRHGNRYYTYRQLTERIPHDDWVLAARDLDRQYRTGPNPDEPDPSP